MREIFFVHKYIYVTNNDKSGQWMLQKRNSLPNRQDLYNISLKKNECQKRKSFTTVYLTKSQLNDF